MFKKINEILLQKKNRKLTVDLVFSYEIKLFNYRLKKGTLLKPKTYDFSEGSRVSNEFVRSVTATVVYELSNKELTLLYLSASAFYDETMHGKHAE